MSTSIAIKINEAFRRGTIARLMGWMASHHFWFSLLAHCCLFAASYLLSFILLGRMFEPGEAEGIIANTTGLLVLFRAAVFGYYSLYQGLWIYTSNTDFLNIIRATVISSLILALMGSFWEAAWIPQRVLILDMILCVAVVCGARMIFKVVKTRIRHAAIAGGQQILLAGPLDTVRTVADDMVSDPLAFYNPVGIIDTSNSKRQRQLRISDLPVFNASEAAFEKKRFSKVQSIVLCWPSSTQEELDAALDMLRPLEIPYTLLPYFDEVLNRVGKKFESDTPSDLSMPQAATNAEKASRRIFLSPPHMAGLEQEFVRRAFQSNYIAPLGPLVDSFEQAVTAKTGASYALALSSGTAAIHLALKVIGVEEGDCVITSTLTFIGGVTPIVYQGAMPIFVDSHYSTWNMDPALLAKALEACAAAGKLPKAVIPTDLYGQCADYDAIINICEPYNVPVIVDAAESVGATYRNRHAGTATMAGIYSFNGNKIITTSGGGMLLSSSKEFIEQARFLAQQARDPFPYYEHSRIGYNYRMSNILAGVGLAQLRVLDERVKRRREIFETYRAALGDMPGIEFMPEASYGQSNRWLTVILITPELFGADRETVRLALEEENIEARPVWKPMHMQPVFEIQSQIQAALTVHREPLTDANNVHCEPFTVERDQQFKSPTPPLSKGTGGIFSTVNAEAPIKAQAIGGQVAEDLFDRGLCLPSGTAMTSTDLDRVIAVIKKCHRK